MIIDSSVIIAILFSEADAQLYAEAIASAPNCRISAANYVEAAVVVESQSPALGARQFDTFMRRAGIAIGRSAKSTRTSRVRLMPTSARDAIRPA